jgi:hypothetical protein
VEVQVDAPRHAVVGAVMAAMFAITDSQGSDFAQTIDESMASIEDSLRL